MNCHERRQKDIRQKQNTIEKKKSRTKTEHERRGKKKQVRENLQTKSTKN